MTSSDVKLMFAVAGNTTLTGVSVFVSKILPVLSAVLIMLQIIAAAATVWHIFFRKKKTHEIPPDSP